MNQLNILIHHRNLQFTLQQYSQLQQKLKTQSSYSINNYLFLKKISSTQWTSTYHVLHTKTRLYHFITIYRLSLIIQEERSQQVKQLRKLSRSIMKMNPNYVVNCYQSLQNDDFIFMVMESFQQQGSLYDTLYQSPKISQFEAIQWIKQIICGLAQLYKQNIYLPQINTKKIVLIDENCKINDFVTIEKKLTQTQDDIVKEHIFEIGKLFYLMITGLKGVSQKNIISIQDNIDTIDKQFGIKLSIIEKDFLKKSLKSQKSQRLSWQEMINHKVFINESLRSSNAQFLKLVQIHPEISYKKRSLTIKLKQQNQASQWDQNNYVEILKIQLILNKLIRDISEQQIFDINERDVIQVLYLLIVRCLNNIRQINQTKTKQQHSMILVQFKQMIEKLQKQISQKFGTYSSMLTEKQNQKTQIGKDWLNLAKSIVKLKFFQNKRRQKFLTGFQSTSQSKCDYTRKQQIEFTQQCINGLLNKCKFHYSDKNHLVYYLKNYKKIMQIKFQQLKQMTFRQKVKQILINSYEENSQ